MIPGPVTQNSLHSLAKHISEEQLLSSEMKSSLLFSRRGLLAASLVVAFTPTPACAPDTPRESTIHDIDSPARELMSYSNSLQDRLYVDAGIRDREGNLILDENNRPTGFPVTAPDGYQAISELDEITGTIISDNNNQWYIHLPMPNSSTHPQASNYQTAGWLRARQNAKDIDLTTHVLEATNTFVPSDSTFYDIATRLDLNPTSLTYTRDVKINGLDEVISNGIHADLLSNNFRNYFFPGGSQESQVNDLLEVTNPATNRRYYRGFRTQHKD